MSRAALRLMPLCASGVVVAVALTSWMLDHHTVQLPPTSAVPQAAQTIGAGTLFSVSEPGGMALCYARTNLITYPPMLSVPHPAPVASYGSSSYGGSSAMQGANP